MMMMMVMHNIYMVIRHKVKFSYNNRPTGYISRTDKAAELLELPCMCCCQMAK